MKILLINQYYYPDIAATAQLCADLCEDLSALGHDVTVVSGTAWYRTPHAGTAALPRPALPLSERHRGVRILRVPVPGGDGLSGRVLGYASFLCGALSRVIIESKPDVVVALSTPPLVAALGLLVQAVRGVRFVYWVQDVYPDLAVRLGVMAAGGVPARLFEALSRALYRRADAVVTLDQAMAERVRAQGARRVHLIDNWSDEAEVTPLLPADNCLRREAGLPAARFTVGYAGNLGRGHDFTTVGDAIVELAGRDPDLSWLFIGDGQERGPLQARVSGLSTVRFLPPQARARLREALTAGDVGLVTLQDGLAGLLVPSKLYGMLAAGRPVVYVGPPAGRVHDLVTGCDVGVSIRNGDVAGLCAALVRLRDDVAFRRRLGDQARAVFQQVFARRLATAHHEAVLREVVGADAGCPGAGGPGSGVGTGAAGRGVA